MQWSPARYLRHGGCGCRESVIGGEPSRWDPQTFSAYQPPTNTNRGLIGHHLFQGHLETSDLVSEMPFIECNRLFSLNKAPSLWCYELIAAMLGGETLYSMVLGRSGTFWVRADLGDGGVRGTQSCSCAVSWPGRDRSTPPHPELLFPLSNYNFLVITSRY